MFNPQPKPAKRGPKPRKPIPRRTPLARGKAPNKRSKRTAWVRRKDAEVQRLIARDGNCCNCREWKSLGGNHRKHRRYRATRWLLSNLDDCCWPCNVALESTPLAKLLELFPNSIYHESWLERLKRKYPNRP